MRGLSKRGLLRGLRLVIGGRVEGSRVLLLIGCRQEAVVNL